MNIVLICIIVGIMANGCATREYNIATGREDIMLIGSEKEVDIGKRIAENIERNLDIKLDTDPLMTERVQKIGQRIADVASRKEIQYSFRVIDKDEMNAFALPGGYVFVFSGLAEKISDDDELACVIAHEIAHIVARHSIKRLQAGLGYDILRIFMAIGSRSARDMRKIDFALNQLMMSYSREDEILADRLAIKYVKEAGFNPFAMLTFLQRLQQINREGPLRPYTPYRTHPYIADRIRIVKQELTGEIDFSDYMNKALE